MLMNVKESQGTVDALQTGGPRTVAPIAWSTVLPYLPTVLVDSVRRSPNRSATWIEPVEGTLVFADVSGFTRMSELLAELGKEGAERLTDIINRFFHRMLDISRGYGGANVKFGGDALLLLFDGEEHAQRAITSALAMQRATRQFPVVRIGRGRVRLSMSVGMHSGSFWSGAAGIPDLRMQHFLLGRETSHVAEAEAAATAGEVVITEATRRLAPRFPVSEARGDFYRVLRPLRGVAAHPGDEPVDPDPSVARELLPYLPPHIAQEAQSGGHARGIEGEHRKVTVLFINLLGVEELLEAQGPGVLLEELQQYVSSLAQVTDRYGGFLVGNDVYTHGLKLILVFGAPVAHEGDSANAFRLATELNQRLQQLDLHLHHRIGINGGFVFAGDVGSSFRRDYTVMGDAVNLSARLMSAASPGQILVSKQIAEEAGPGFVLGELTPISVKGKSRPVAIAALGGERIGRPGQAEDEPTAQVAREAEFAALQRLSNEVESAGGRAAVISGDVGMGKSSLVHAFYSFLLARSWAVYRGQCYAYTTANPFAPWIHAMKSFFNIAPEDTTEASTEKVVATIEHLTPEFLEIASLLNPLLALSIRQTDVTRFLDGEVSRRRLFEMVVGLLHAAGRDRPLALVLEDLQWADSSSIQLVNRVGASLDSSRLMLCVTHRPTKDLQLDLPQALTTTISLGELSESAALELVRKVLGHQEIPDQLAKVILSKAGGNPFFLEEVAQSIRRSGSLDRISRASSMGLADSVDVPDSVQGLIMAQIDALDGVTKTVLRAASVIGNVFDRRTLQSLFGTDVGEAALEARLQELVRLNLAQREEGPQEPTYRFRQTLIQEVAYESLLFARRRQLHEHVGAYIEEAHQERLEPLYEELERHYRGSGNFEKALVYATKSATKARQIFANAEAIEYYRRGLAALERLGGHVAQERSYLMEGIGECHEVSGRHAEAVSCFSTALRGWRAAAKARASQYLSLLDIADNQGTKAREAALCRKIGVAYERNSGYDASLKWLDSAFRALPTRETQLAAQILVARCVALFRKGLYKEAVECGRRGLALSGRSGDPRQVAYAHDMLASSYLELGKLREVIQHRSSAVSIYEEVKDLPGLVVGHNNLGSGYQLLGELDKAVEHYEASIQAGQRVGNLMAVAVVHSNIGEVLLIQGRLSEAIGHFQRTVETYEKEGYPLAASGLALVNLSRAHQRTGDHATSAACLQRGMGLLQKVGARGLLTEAVLQEAELALATGQVESAVRRCQRALRDAKEMGMRLLEARALRIMGRISLAQQRHQEAETHLRQSAALATRLNADHERGLALLALAELYGESSMRRGLRRHGVVALRQAMEAFRRLGAEGDITAAQELQRRLGW